MDNLNVSRHRDDGNLTIRQWYALYPNEVREILIDLKKQAKKIQNMQENECYHPIFTNLAWQELLKIDPEGTKTAIHREIDELEPKSRGLIADIRRTDAICKRAAEQLDIQTLVYSEWEVYKAVANLNILEKYLKFLKWLIAPNPTKSEIDDRDIDNARNVPLESILGINLKPAGSHRQKGICPFHKEKTASFTVYTDQNRWHCFGCGKSGDSIGYLTEKQGLTFKEAVSKLKGVR